MRKTIIFVDSRQTVNGVPTALCEISGVALLKRVVLDARRAGVAEPMSVVMDQPHDDINLLLKDERVNLTPVYQNQANWQASVIDNRVDSALVLTADRLYDYRVLAGLEAVRLEGEQAVVAVDARPPDAAHENERQFMVYDGKLIDDAAHDRQDSWRDVGAYVFNRATLEAVIDLPAARRAAFATDLIARRLAARYDIGIGFVQEIKTATDIKRAEQRIIRYIWKVTDGVHAKLNKKIALPFIKLLLKTPLTPNMISVAGVLVSLLSAYFFLRGDYVSTVIGAFIAYVSALFDHFDGSIARLKSMESAFGCYFEQICDFIFYFSFAAGLAGGLYHATHNPIYLTLGGALFIGVLFGLLTLSYQRKVFAENPSQYGGKAQQVMDANKRNPIYRFGSKTYFVVKRPVMPYYLFIFTVLNALPFVLLMAALSANLYWIIQLYSNRIFRAARQPKTFV